MASRVEQENWDDDFEFSNSPRNSPIPAVAPIHTFSHMARSGNISGHSRGTQPLPSPSASSHPQHQRYPQQHHHQQQHVNSYRSNPDLHQHSNSALRGQHSSSSKRPIQQQQGQSHSQRSQQPRQQYSQQQPPQHQQYAQQQQQQQPPQPQQYSQHTSLHPEAAQPHGRKARWSGNSEENWDMDTDPPAVPAGGNSSSQQPSPTTTKPTSPPLVLPIQHTVVDHGLQHYTDHPQPRPSLDSHSPSPQGYNRDTGNGGNVSPTMSAFSIPLSIDSSIRNHPHGHHRDPSLTGHSMMNQSMTNQSISGAHSIGGSSTNFLLHTGRRSVLEMEKGRQQDRERRRLRKKSRPSPGALPIEEFEHGRPTVPRRYAIPSNMRRGDEDGDESSIERGSSGEDELSELEEERSTPAQPLSTTSAHPITMSTSPLIKAPSRLLNLALNQTKSHDRLTASSNPTSSSSPSSPGVGSASMSRATGMPLVSGAKPVGIGSRSTTVTTVPASQVARTHGHGYINTDSRSTTHTYGHSTPHSQTHGLSTPHGPSKLVRKVSGTNVLTKSSPHMRGNASLGPSVARLPSSSARVGTTASSASHPTSPIAHLSSSATPVTSSSTTRVTSSSIARPSLQDTRPAQQDTPPQAQISKHDASPVKVQVDDGHSIQQHSHSTQQLANVNPTQLSPSQRSKALDDCSASIAPSTSSHKEKRQPLLSRLGSLKRWGYNSGSPSTSSHSGLGLGLGSTLGLSRPGRESVSPRVFTTSRLPSFLGGSKVDLHASNDQRVGGEHKVGSDASLARSPGRKYGLLRKPSLVLSNASSSALAREEREDEHFDARGKEESGTHGKRGLNPFRRVSIQGVKRLVGDHLHHHHHHEDQHEGVSTTSAGTPEKEKKSEKDSSGGHHHHHRTISFTALARGKLGGTGADKSFKHKESGTAGRKSSDGRDPTSATSNGNSAVGPHTLGRTAALAKAPKPPLKPLSPTSFDSSADAEPQPALRSHANSVSTTESIGSMRIPIPSSISTATSAGYQSSATSAAQSSTHKRTTSGATTATTSSQSQSSPISTSPPFSLVGSRPYQDHQQSLAPSHTRDATIKPATPLSPTVTKGYSAAENTPKPRANVKPLPEMTPVGTAATVGRFEGKSAAAAAREAGMRRGSAGDSSRTTVSAESQSRRGGDLKIPARISMRQGSLKRELEAVKEFATSVDELKRLQATHQAIVTALSPNPKRSSSRASNHPVNPATLQSVEAQYGIWWECAELLVDLGGAAPPTVAGTPIQENQPSFNGSVGRPHGGASSGSTTGHYGTQRSFSSSSSAGDLSSRQLELLKQMLSTPNPTSFTFSGPSSATKGRSGAEFSGSGSDHVVSDPPSSSTHGTKSSINSASSLHDHRPNPSSISRAQAPSTNYPYSQGTWTSKGRSSANPVNSRPNLSGVFETSGDQNRTPTGKPALRGESTSRGTLGGSSSSATGGLVTTDDAEEDASDWDIESSDSGKGRKAPAAKAPSSTASSSVDMSQLAHAQTRLALTPETILPLLVYAREVKARLVDCLEELERARAKSRSSPATTATTTTGSTTPYSSRSSRAPEVGTSTLRRA